MQELKIFIYEDNNRLFTQIDDSPQELKFPKPYWNNYDKTQKIENNQLLVFEKIYKNLKLNEELVIQIISKSTLAHSIPFEIMAYKALTIPLPLNSLFVFVNSLYSRNLLI